MAQASIIASTIRAKHEAELSGEHETGHPDALMGHSRSMTTMLNVEAAREQRKKENAALAERLVPGAGKICHTILHWLDSVALQAALYLLFVIVFQMLASSFRSPKEFYLDKAAQDRIVENHFDSSHNTLMSVRRHADIWEWGNNVLWPGLFADLGPCDSAVGLPGTASVKSCNDDAWSDGEGSFGLGYSSAGGLTGAPTPLGLEELVERMDMFDWTEGVLVKQGRATPGVCAKTDQLGPCLPDIMDKRVGSTTPFGYNWTVPGAALAAPFEYISSGELGGNPDGFLSAAVPSQKVYESGGYVALAIPFFSDTFLPPQEGRAHEVTDFQAHRVTTTNGRTPRFYCVRVSPNGRRLKQLCDPGSGGNGTGHMTGAVRATVEEWWNDLKRAHFIDARSRVLSITLPIKSNHEGVRYRMSILFEMTSLAGVLPSYDIETMITDRDSIEGMETWANVALGLVLMFVLLDLNELHERQCVAYFNDIWNVLDWLNYVIFFLVYAQVLSVLEYHRRPQCSSAFCWSTGYHDDWQLMGAYRNAKTFLSLCLCIQLFKIQKFASALVPKMGLATAVLRKCVVDLLFFGVTFFITMLAFSMMMYVQMGPHLADYWDQTPAFIALFRALFGDFDIDEILDHSSGYLNALLFLGYLFVAVFIFLSMFLAILAEAQVAVREDQQIYERWVAHSGQADSYSEYGVLHKFNRGVGWAADAVSRGVSSLCRRDVDGGEGSARETRKSRKAASEAEAAQWKQRQKAANLQDVYEVVCKLQQEVLALQAARGEDSSVAMIRRDLALLLESAGARPLGQSMPLLPRTNENSGALGAMEA